MNRTATLGLIAAAALAMTAACSSEPAVIKATATSHQTPTVKASTKAPTQSFDTIMRRDGHTADQIDTVDTYRQAACSTLTDNPTLKTNWNATTVKTEIQDSYNITLGNEAVAAILASCK